MTSTPDLDAPPRDDEYRHGLPALLDAVTLQSLSQVSPWRSSAHITFEWGVLLLAIWYGAWHAPVWLYPLLVCVIGARQHALVVLIHEGAHMRLYRQRALNDWVAEALLSWPFLLFTMHAYRRNHWPHHRHTNGRGDPDWERKQTHEWRFPKARGELFRQLASYALGIGFLRFVVTAARLPKPTGEQDRDPLPLRIARPLFLAGLAVALTLAKLWTVFLLFWLLPFVTWFQFAFHIRSIAEHFAIDGRRAVFARTRTVLPGLLGRLLLVPKNAGYHLEHHLYPGVPFFNLPKLHALLMARPEYRGAAHITQGYHNVLRECLPDAEADKLIGRSA